MTLRAWEERTIPASVGTIPRAWRRISGCPTSCSRRRSCCEIADGVYVRASAAAVTDPSSTTASNTCRRLTSSMPEHTSAPRILPPPQVVEALLQGTVAIRDGTSLRRGPLWVPAGHTQSRLQPGRQRHATQEGPEAPLRAGAHRPGPRDHGGATVPRLRREPQGA